MKQLLMSTATLALTATTAFADGHATDVKIGVLLGFTGPIESLSPAIAQGAELAISEVSNSGALLDNAKVEAIRGDSTCVDAAAATATAERLVTSDKVNAIMGAGCSGVTGAVLANVARANGVVMISPSATSPALSTAEDDGLFFRTAPSDARQGEIMSDILNDRDVKNVALTYTNNDYGKGLADAFQAAFEADGGTVTLSAAHEDGKADYSAEVGALASAGGDVLVVAGYVDQGGSGVIRSALDTGAFDTFYLPDGMVGTKLNENFGSEIEGSFGSYPGTDSDGVETFQALAKDAGFDGASVFSAEGYDAAALIMLAMQAADSTDSNVFKAKVMDVANAPGVKIYPGELEKGLKLIAEGQEIDYVGASAVELIGAGESSGSFQEIEMKDGAYSTVNFR